MKLLITILLFQFASALHAQNFSDIDKKATQYKFTKDYNKAATDLTAGYDDDLSKARVIFSWIAHNIKYDEKHKAELKSKSRRDNKIKGPTEEIEQFKKDRIHKAINRTLKKKKGVCQDYAWLYQAMCESVGLETAFISGFGRFSPHNIGKVHNRGNHAWNAVNINDRWRLMDVTWSAGMGSNENYGDGFFDIAPELFVLSHHPTEDIWQLLDSPISKEVFAAQPFMYPGFIVYDVKKIVPASGKISHDHTLSIEIDLKPGQNLIIKKGKKFTKDTFKSNGSLHYLDLSKTRLLGKIIICIQDGNKVLPLLALKVIS